MRYEKPSQNLHPEAFRFLRQELQISLPVFIRLKDSHRSNARWVIWLGYFGTTNRDILAISAGYFIWASLAITIGIMSPE